MIRSRLAITVHFTTIVLIAAVIAQISLWRTYSSATPVQEIVPRVPARETVVALSLGDTQAAYRAMGLKLQNFGDTNGRWSALADYDYARLVGWFELLTSVEPQAWYVPAQAAAYYAQTPRPDDARRVVDFLVAFARRDTEARWRLLAHAVYLARHRIGDLPYALEIARSLAAVEVSDMPFWPRQLPALILVEMGRMEDAAREMRSLGAEFPDMPPEEARYQIYFLEHVLGLSPDAVGADDLPAGSPNQ